MLRTLATALSALAVSSAPVAIIALTLPLVACGGKAESETRRIDAAIARGSNPPGLTMTVCGRVVSYVAGDANHGGSIELDRGKWDLVPAAPVAFEVLLAPGADVCVHASLDTDQRIRGAYVYTPEDEDSQGPVPVSAGEEADGDEANVTSARVLRAP